MQHYKWKIQNDHSGTILKNIRDVVNATLHSYGYGFMSQDSPNQTVLNDLCWGDDRKNNLKKWDPPFWRKEPLPYLPSNHFKLIEVYLRKKSQTQLVLQKLMTSFGPGIGWKSFFLMKRWEASVVLSSWLPGMGCLELRGWLIPPVFCGWFLWWIGGADSPTAKRNFTSIKPQKRTSENLVGP